MLTVLRFAAFLALLIAAHLGTRDRRKGSHRQATHGNRYRAENGKRILASAGGSSRSRSKASSASRGRKITETNFGAKKRAVFAEKPKDDDDPFAEDYGDEPKSKEDLKRERMERQIIAQMQKADRQKVYQAIQDQGGLKTNTDLREEYSGIPNTFKRKDGLAGDQMADHLATYYPELGIRDERDLIDYLAA